MHRAHTSTHASNKQTLKGDLRLTWADAALTSFPHCLAISSKKSGSSMSWHFPLSSLKQDID